MIAKKTKHIHGEPFIIAFYDFRDSVVTDKRWRVVASQKKGSFATTRFGDDIANTVDAVERDAARHITEKRDRKEELRKAKETFEEAVED